MTTTNEKFDVMSNAFLKSLVLEAGAERVLNAEGKAIRLFPGDPRSGTLLKDPAYCSGQLFNALPRERGEVGLWFLAQGVIAKDPSLAPHREEIRAAIWDALPPCQHPVDYDAMPITGGHPGDYHVPPAGSGSLKRQQPRRGFFNVVEMLEHAAGTGPEPVSVVKWESPALTEKGFNEPVFLVRTPDDQSRLWLSIDGREKLEAGQFSVWYSKFGIMTVSSIESAVAATEEDPALVKKMFAGRPAVLTFPSEKLISLFTEAGIPTASVNGIPESWEAFLREVQFVGKAVGVGAADMPEAVLDGWLGEICRTRMSRHAIAYAWPALLTVAGMLVDGKANLFTCLVGGPGTGKGQAIDHALKLFPLPDEMLMTLKAGSAEGLVAMIGDIQGRHRLFSPDEILHTMQKAQIEGASFASIFNSAFDAPLQNLTLARGKQVTFNCRLSIIGGVVTDKFGDAFSAATTGGLYDRFIFGLGPTGYTYHYEMFEGGPALRRPDIDDENFVLERPIPVSIDQSVYKETSAWLTADPKLGRLIQLAIRAAYIAAAFDGRPVLHANDLGPARAFLDYQKRVRQAVAPNAGETNEGILCSKFMNYLRGCANEGLPVSEREMYASTHAYDYGAGQAGKALGALALNGDVERYKVGRKFYVRLTKD